MGRSAVTFTLGAGSGQGAAQSADANSSIIFYGTAPGTFAATATQPVYSLQDAITKGIAADYADETPATGSLVISGVGSTGDIITVTVTEKLPNGATQVVNLCTYVQAVGDTTATILAASIAAAINANSYLTANGFTGYTASAGTGTITFTARTGLGINLNTVSVVPTLTGGITTGTNTAFSGGVYSKKAIWNYHVSEFFRTSALLGNEGAVLYVSFFASVSGTYADISTAQNGALGASNRIGVYSFVAKSVSQVVSDIDLMEAQARSLFSAYTPAAIFFAPNIKAINNVSTLLNLQQATGQANGGDKDVICIISQDGNAAGAQLYVNSGVSISNIGAILGTSAAAAVSQNMGEVGVFNISNGVENNIPAFTTGELFGNLAASLLNQLDSYRYCFCTTYPQYGGTYINNDFTSVIQTSNYSRLGRVLTINKFERQTYQALLPLLKSRIYLNADGTMSIPTIQKYTGPVEQVIEQFVANGDLSPGNISGTAVTKGVININPAQNVQSQGYIAITYNLLAVDIADNIQVTLQYTQSL